MEESLLDEFIVESQENLEACEQSLLAMETGIDETLVNDVFRAIHSVKGASGFLKKHNIERVAHDAEALLSLIRDDITLLTPDITTLLLEAVDRLKGMLADSAFGEHEDISEVCARLSASTGQLKGGTAEEAPPKKSAVSFSPEHVATAFKQKAANTFLYGIFISYLPDRSGNIEEELTNALSDIGKIVHISDPLEHLSDQTPQIEIFVESILEPGIMDSCVGIEGCELMHLDEKATVQAPPGQQDTAEKTAPAQTAPKTEKPPAGAGKKKPAPAAVVQQSGKPSKQTIRIGVNVLDELLELIGEVVLGRNQFLNKFHEDDGFKSLSQSITKLHQHVIQTRMQSIGTLFDKYRRTVRDLSKQLNKKIDLTIEGGDLELDRTIIEGLSDPLTHLVRNSIDHGIELPEDRSKLGKSVVGTLSLRAIHESGQILIEIEDDGRGLDREKIIAKALEKQIISQEETGGLDEKTIFDFIFHPGFSTKDQATEISGRGVGMDVVKTNLKKLGCNVELRSRKNKGTLVSISIPLTQAVVNSSVISGVIISIGQHSLAIPQLAVNEIIKLDDDSGFEKIETVKGREVFKLRDKIIPLVHLEDILGIKRTCYNPRTQTFVEDRRKKITLANDDQVEIDRRKRGIIFIVLNYKHEYFGILVDKIERTEEIVVKRLPKIIKNRKVFAGATILGNGKVALILDISGMVEMANLNFDKKQESSFDFFRTRTIRQDTQRVVVFNNAEEEYFAIPVNLLSEVDRFFPDEVRTVGEREFIKRHGESVPLLRLENSLKVKPLSPSRQSHIILIPSRLRYPTGIVGSNIISIIELREDINTKEADNKGIMGTFFFESKLVNLLDIYMLLQRSDPERYRTEIDAGIEKCRVLFVDDQLFFRQLVAQYFKSYGIQDITVAKNGQEVLQVLYEKSGQFDVVVSDIEMPGMNGYQLVASIKSDNRFSHLPVMALTTLDTEQSIKKGYEAGFDAYEVKLDKESVIKRLEQLYLSKYKN